MRKRLRKFLKFFGIKSPAEDRATHPEGEDFRHWFKDLLWKATDSCFERDVLRDNQDNLWKSWKKRAKEFDDVEKERLKNG